MQCLGAWIFINQIRIHFLRKKTKIELSVIFLITPKFWGPGKPYITPLPSNGRKHQPTIGPEEDPVRQKLFNQAGELFLLPLMWPPPFLIYKFIFLKTFSAEKNHQMLSKSKYMTILRRSERLGFGGAWLVVFLRIQYF